MTSAISVVIACRNAESTIGVQLEALAAQHLDEPWEVLLCDNSSSDGTLDVVRGYQRDLPGLHVIPATGGQGPAYARNVGAAASTARWLAFVDADDEVSSGWLAAMAAGLRQHDFIAGRFDATRLNSPDVVRSRQLDQIDGLQHSLFGPALPHAGGGNMGIARTVFESVGGFDGQLPCLEDTDLCWRVQLAGCPLVFWPDALVHVRLRSSLRGMWTQGRNYGAATADLEQRYGAMMSVGDAAPESLSAATLTVTPRGGEAQGKTRARGSRHDIVRSIREVVRHGATPGLLIWKAGWHVGRRRRRWAGAKATKAKTPQAA
jgi:cellulose synthase/poly-beta-1,6-N-acetylglucosamine synthase-like glycosyltransferase